VIHGSLCLLRSVLPIRLPDGTDEGRTMASGPADSILRFLA